MSFYQNLRPTLPSYRIDAGWDARGRSYFLHAYNVPPENPRRDKPFVELGTPTGEPIPCLYDLVNYSWSLVDWQVELATLQQLVIDPVLEDHRIRARQDFLAAGDDLRKDVSTLIQLAYRRSSVVDLAANPQIERPAHK